MPLIIGERVLDVKNPMLYGFDVFEV